MVTRFAKLFQNGNSQAVRLPREMRFKGDKVRIRRVPDGVLLQPAIRNVAEWFAEMDRYGDSDAYPRGWRNQAKAPARKVFE